MKEYVTNSQKRNRREDEILDAALEVFAELGFKKASVEDIAGKLGLSPGALYRYAEDKRDLYRKAVARAFLLWQEKVEAAASRETEPLARFRVICGSAFRYLSDEPRLRKVLSRDPSLFPFFEAEDPFLEINRSSEALLESCIRDGIASGAFAPKSEADIRAVGRVLFSLYVLFVQKAYVAEEDAEAVLFERGLDLILDGLRSR